MRDKTDSQITNNLKIQLDSLRETQKTYCLLSTHQDKVLEHEETFKRIFESKVDKTWASDKFSDQSKVMKENEAIFEEYKVQILKKFDY